jgi:beta-lactamase regulating signal transducer with metallopeptidase domain
MRLLIYLLAMMTGFSAAESARPVSATPAAVAQAAVIASTAASAELEIAANLSEYRPSLSAVSAGAIVGSVLPVVAGSPVSRYDISRQ